MQKRCSNDVNEEAASFMQFSILFMLESFKKLKLNASNLSESTIFNDIMQRVSVSCRPLRDSKCRKKIGIPAPGNH